MDTKKTKTQGAAAEPVARVISASEVFRESFLFVLDIEDAEIARRFGEVLQDRFLDRAVYEKKSPHLSFTLAEVLGVAADLRFLGGFLRSVGSERRLSELTATEQALSSFAEGLAPEVAALAGRLEEEIKRLTSDDEDDEQAEASVDDE